MPQRPRNILLNGLNMAGIFWGGDLQATINTKGAMAPFDKGNNLIVINTMEAYLTLCLLVKVYLYRM
jgi:hypothetical protein